MVQRRSLQSGWCTYLSGAQSSCCKTAAKISGHLFISKYSAMLEKKSWLLSTQNISAQWIMGCPVTYLTVSAQYHMLPYNFVTCPIYLLSLIKTKETVNFLQHWHKICDFFSSALGLIYFSFYILLGECSQVHAHIFWNVQWMHVNVPK